MKEDNILTVETLKKAKIKMVDNETTKEKSVIISETEWLNFASEVGKLERKLDIARAALEFYGDKGSYINNTKGYGLLQSDDCDCSERGGKRARHALKEVE